MDAQTQTPLIDHEEAIIKIMRKLSADRLAYLMEFARFLEYQTIQSPQIKIAPQEIDDEARWEELLIRPEGKQHLRALAYEARAEYLAGQTTDIQETEDGRLAPG